MKKLNVHKQLEKTPMIGPFTPNELIVLMLLSIIVFVATLAVNQYIISIPTGYTLIIICISIIASTWVKSHFKGLNLIEYITFLRYPKQLHGGVFEPKNLEKNEKK